MFGVSFPELMVVFLIALLVFGPDKLPELARTIGKFTGQFRRQSDSLRREFYNSVYKPAEDMRGAINREARSLVSEPIITKNKIAGEPPKPMTEASTSESNTSNESKEGNQPQ
jgi:Tat protein translocase TatB subunit